VKINFAPDSEIIDFSLICIYNSDNLGHKSNRLGTKKSLSTRLAKMILAGFSADWRLDPKPLGFLGLKSTIPSRLSGLGRLAVSR
jgi:hypothetical protein